MLPDHQTHPAGPAQSKTHNARTKPPPGGVDGGGSVNDDNQSVGNQSVQSVRSLVSVGGLIDRLKGGQGSIGQGDNRMGGMASPMTFNDSETLTHQPTPHHHHHHHNAMSNQGPLGELMVPGDDMANMGRPMTDQLDSPGRDLFDNHPGNMHGSFQLGGNSDVFEDDRSQMEKDASSRYYNRALVAEIHRLKKQLRDVEDDVEQLTLEKFKLLTEKDCTPSAMLFFTALHDPKMIPTLQQLIIQLQALKGLAGCTAHMDFVSLRKRLMVCVSATQTLDNFVVRYTAMHKKWVYNRFAMYANPSTQNRSSGERDSSSLCPLCSSDLTGTLADVSGALLALNDEAIQMDREQQILQQGLHGTTPAASALARIRNTAPHIVPSPYHHLLRKRPRTGLAKLEPIVSTYHVPANLTHAQTQPYRGGTAPTGNIR